MRLLTASTQYDDWKGTVAADNADIAKEIDSVFESTGKVTDDDFLVAFEFFAGENSVHLFGYYHPKSNSAGGWIPSLKKDFEEKSGAIPLKRVQAKLTLEEFFSYFKRFSVVLAQDDIGIIGREVEFSD